MLKTIEYSSATKTRGIATTYRAGTGNQYSTCPSTCELNPSGGGASTIDHDYFNALLYAVPRGGSAFTYSHFNYIEWSAQALPLAKNKTVINYSAPSLDIAAEAMRVGIASCVVVAPEYWNNGNSNTHGSSESKGLQIIQTDAIKVVRCPAEYNDKFSCNDCGGKNKPLCARGDRGYIIGFTAHGTGKKAALDNEQQKGCYAAYHHVAMAWKNTANSVDTGETDGDKLTRFASGLRAGSVLRHHVAGDMGKQAISLSMAA